MTNTQFPPDTNRSRRKKKKKAKPEALNQPGKTKIHGKNVSVATSGQEEKSHSIYIRSQQTEIKRSQEAAR